ncbi:MAG: VRR-NUC domain-containing protein, partial [Chloroflexi bacterium]|nr:VRR-NUC domain-containing protein [Chloroflexota bacterium]
QSDDERELQDDFHVYLSAVDGLEWWDTSRIGLSGYPDLQATLHGDSLFFEVKASTGRVQPQQERWHEHMRQTGATVEVVRSVDDVKHVIARLNAGQM